MKKILIIRLSSFGDIVHTMALLRPLKEEWPDCHVSWLVRKDLESILQDDSLIDFIYAFERQQGFFGLIKLSLSLRHEFDFIYDAHNNMRSSLFRLFVSPFTKTQIIIRSKERFKRILLFKFRVNKFPKPYKAMKSYWQPLKQALGIKRELGLRKWPVLPSPKMREELKERIVLVPATAWPMKSWPVEHFKKLVEILPEYKFLLLGGPNDHFCRNIVKVAPDRVLNLAGKLSLAESFSISAYCRFIVTADTGLQQVADLSGVSGVSLIGPTAFGFSTMGTLKTLEVDLPCRPCTKDGSGHCSRKIYQECMVAITPKMVAEEILKIKN